MFLAWGYRHLESENDHCYLSGLFFESLEISEAESTENSELSMDVTEDDAINPLDDDEPEQQKPPLRSESFCSQIHYGHFTSRIRVSVEFVYL